MKRVVLMVVFGVFALPALAQTDYLSLGKGMLDTVASAKGGKATANLGAGLSDAKIGSGIKEALRVGTQRAVAAVGRPGGFMNDKQVHIPLPGPLAKVKSALALAGASGMADDLEARMNKAAEQAAPKAAKIFGDAVAKMSVDDARGILSGPKDSATQYFRRMTSSDIATAMKPIIDKSLADVGAVKSFNDLTTQVRALPIPAKYNLDINEYVSGKTLDGIFTHLAKQEADIRTNPAARSTDLLKAVFR